MPSPLIIPAHQGPRLVLFAYSHVGACALRYLLERQAPLVAVFTHEDKPGENIWFESVKDLAQAHGLPVYTPGSLSQLKNPTLTQWWHSQLRPDLVLSCYYRHLIPMGLLDVARLGAFNLHGSLLPRYRGRACIHWALIHGETQTGVTLHTMVKAADAGDIVDQEAFDIGPFDDALDVTHRAGEAARTLLARQYEALLAGRAPRRAQDHSQATVFGGRRPEDGRIDWSQTAQGIHNLVRAVTRPFPGAFSDQLVAGQRAYLWRSRPYTDLASLEQAQGPIGQLAKDKAPARSATANGQAQPRSWNSAQTSAAGPAGELQGQRGTQLGPGTTPQPAAPCQAAAPGTLLACSPTALVVAAGQGSVLYVSDYSLEPLTTT